MMSTFIGFELSWLMICDSHRETANFVKIRISLREDNSF